MARVSNLNLPFSIFIFISFLSQHLPFFHAVLMAETFPPTETSAAEALSKPGISGSSAQERQAGGATQGAKGRSSSWELGEEM